MRISSPGAFALSCCTLLLCACASQSPAAPADHAATGHGAMDHAAMTETPGRAITLREEAAAPGQLAFALLEGGAVFTDVGIGHTKEMHLIAVRDDLRHFQHLHPERDATGVWKTAFTPEAGGTYRFYADFVEQDGTNHVLRFQKTLPGDTGAYGVVQDAARIKTVDGYRIEHPSVPLVDGKHLSFVYIVSDAAGKMAELEEYLGAIGHSVLLSPSGDYVHAHAQVSEHGDPEFLVTPPKEQYYRAFTQFQVGGKVITVPFDWQG